MNSLDKIPFILSLINKYKKVSLLSFKNCNQIYWLMASQLQNPTKMNL